MEHEVRAGRQRGRLPGPPIHYKAVEFWATNYWQRCRVNCKRPGFDVPPPLASHGIKTVMRPPPSLNGTPSRATPSPKPYGRSSSTVPASYTEGASSDVRPTLGRMQPLRVPSQRAGTTLRSRAGVYGPIIVVKPPPGLGFTRSRVITITASETTGFSELSDVDPRARSLRLGPIPAQTPPVRVSSQPARSLDQSGTDWIGMSWGTVPTSRPLSMPTPTW